MSNVIELPQQYESGIVKPRLPKINVEDIPEPLLWYTVVLPVTIPTETESGIVIAADTVRHMNLSKRVGVVLKIGPMAYSEHRGFPAGYHPIEVGDWVHFHEHAGIDTTMIGPEGLVMLKFLEEKHILGKPRRPELHMVMI